MTELLKFASSLHPHALLSSPSFTSPASLSSTNSIAKFKVHISSPCVHLNPSHNVSNNISTWRFCNKYLIPVRVSTSAGALEVEEEEGDVGYDVEDEDEGVSMYGRELGFEGEGDERGEEVGVAGGDKVKRTFRSLGNREKKELRAYAHQLGNDICLHQVFWLRILMLEFRGKNQLQNLENSFVNHVGKWGVSASCVTAISDALEANELVKVRVLDNLDEELDDTVRQLEMKTEAQIVGRIGRTLLLYRPSIRKLKAAQAAQEKALKNQRRRPSMSSRSVGNNSSSGATRRKR